MRRLTRATLRTLPRLPISMISSVLGGNVSAYTSPAGKAQSANGFTAPSIDAFMCVHSRDLACLFELALRSYEVNFQPQGRLFLISNDLDALRAVLDRTGLGGGAELISDDDCLSVKERALPGWYRQQIIKLRSYEFCETDSFCNLGADTLLLQPVTSADLISGGRPILYFNGPRPASLVSPDFWLDRWYELTRLDYVARILQVNPAISRRYVDFIFDLFCFHREYLVDLNRYIEGLYGSEPYHHLLAELGDSDRKQFGEWTLYSMFLLDCIGAPVEVRSSAASFLRQIRNQRILRTYRFDSKVVHFVDKGTDPAEISRRIIASDLPLGRYLAVGADEAASAMGQVVADEPARSTYAW